MLKKNSMGCALYQSHYIDKILSKFSHLHIKEVGTPFDVSNKLIKNMGRYVRCQLKYASVIDSLMYAVHSTRPDIAYTVCLLARFTHNLSAYHWRAIRSVLGHLLRTKSFGLFYNKFILVLVGYYNAK